MDGVLRPSRWCHDAYNYALVPALKEHFVDAVHILLYAGRVAWCVFVKGTLASPCPAQAILGRSIPECEAGPVEQAP